jgi:hypothetical protein
VHNPGKQLGERIVATLGGFLSVSHRFVIGRKHKPFATCKRSTSRHRVDDTLRQGELPTVETTVATAVESLVPAADPAKTSMNFALVAAVTNSEPKRRDKPLPFPSGAAFNQPREFKFSWNIIRRPASLFVGRNCRLSFGEPQDRDRPTARLVWRDGHGGRCILDFYSCAHNRLAIVILHDAADGLASAKLETELGRRLFAVRLEPPRPHGM